MRSEHSWSVLDPRPVLLYLPRLDEYIVYWNGLAMTHSQALCFAMETIGVYSTPEMKRAMDETHKRVYYANGFQTQNWDNIIRNSNTIFDYLKGKIRPHVKAVCEGKTPQEILGWFDYKKARIEEQHE